MEFLNNFKTCFLDVFLFAPFICSFILGIFVALKNPIHIRLFAKIFFTVQFFFAAFLFMCVEKTSFSILNINFVFDKFNAIFILFSSLLFLLFLFISKTFIIKLHRMFYSVFALLYGLLNLFILSKNIFLALAIIFWMFLLRYFLFESYFKNTKKRRLRYSLVFDCILVLVAIFLIGWDFARYFVLNNISFDFLNLSQYLYHINDESIKIAFCGFLILIFKLFDLIPFNTNEYKNTDNINSFIVLLNKIICLIMGVVLFVNVFVVFDYLLYQTQEYIAIFLLSNFVYFVILSYREDYLFKFFLNIIPVILISGIFCVFSFENSGIISFVYYALCSILSICLCGFVFALIKNKFKTDKLDELKRITQKARAMKFFVVFSLLNIAKVPFLAMFSASLVGFVLIFSTTYNGIVLQFMPYILFIGNFILSLNLLNMIYKILIEPQEYSNQDLILSNHQMMPMFVLVFFIVLIGISVQTIFNLLSNVVNIGVLN